MPVKEPIRVAVIFEPGRRLRPVWFGRKNQKYIVKEITYAWQERLGDKVLQHFTVTDGEALYELIYSAADGTWTLGTQQAAS